MLSKIQHLERGINRTRFSQTRLQFFSHLKIKNHLNNNSCVTFVVNYRLSPLFLVVYSF